MLHQFRHCFFIAIYDFLFPLSRRTAETMNSRCALITSRGHMELTSQAKNEVNAPATWSHGLVLLAVIIITQLSTQLFHAF